MWLKDKINVGDLVICGRHTAQVVLISFTQSKVGDGRKEPIYRVRWRITGWISDLERDEFNLWRRRR